MCSYVREYHTPSGWVYYCDVTATGKKLSPFELRKAGCTKKQRKKCAQRMEQTCGMAILPQA